jgi:hypothetical protein
LRGWGIGGGLRVLGIEGFGMQVERLFVLIPDPALISMAPFSTDAAMHIHTML